MRESETIDGVWCRPHGGARPIIGSAFPREKAIRLDNEYNRVWLARASASADEPWQLFDGYHSYVSQEVAERIVDRHEPEMTATLPVSESPFTDAEAMA